MFCPDYYLLPVLAAKEAAVSVSSAPIGLGPFNAPSEAAFVAAALRGSELAVRDAGSLAFCREHGLTAQQALDDGFRVAELIPGLARRPVVGNRRKIGVCIYRQHGDPNWPQTKRWWSGLLSALRGQDVSGFCFHSEPGLDYGTTAELLGDGRVAPWTGDWKEAATNVGGFDAMISARYHAVVVANTLGIPNIAVAASDYYRAKMTAAKRPQDHLCRVVNPHSESPEESANVLLF
ncbi:MAG: polysaccharide pyruvyl transferase family protein [Verrucomicrobia bacterium]|nr:polysaccharide pyruvyl transferase family protein [Verrucomicrobiota bacterium]